MGFIYGLAVVLLIFEGIIVQCEGTGDTEGARIAECPDLSTIDTKEGLGSLPNELIKEIVDQIDREKISEIVRNGIEHECSPLMSIILPNCIIHISTRTINEETSLNYYDDNLYVNFGIDQKLELFLKNCGEYVRKMHIGFILSSDDESRFFDSIEKFAKNVEDLQFKSYDPFLDALSKRTPSSIFPEVKRLHIEEDIDRNEFKFNLIFPKLESLSLKGTVVDINFFSNVKRLKELTLFIVYYGMTYSTPSIPDDKIDHILVNNKDMEKFSVFGLRSVKTMQSIAEHLKNLKILEVNYPDEDFLLKKVDPVCELPSVKHFYFTCQKMPKMNGIGNLPFAMPELEMLTFNVYLEDIRCVKFLGNFKKLETVEIVVGDSGFDWVQFMEPTWKLLEEKKNNRLRSSYLKFSKSR